MGAGGDGEEQRTAQEEMKRDLLTRILDGSARERRVYLTPTVLLTHLT